MIKTSSETIQSSTGIYSAKTHSFYVMRLDYISTYIQYSPIHLSIAKVFCPYTFYHHLSIFPQVITYVKMCLFHRVTKTNTFLKDG